MSIDRWINIIMCLVLGVFIYILNNQYIHKNQFTQGTLTKDSNCNSGVAINTWIATTESYQFYCIAEGDPVFAYHGKFKGK